MAVVIDDPRLLPIREKVEAGERLSFDDGVTLYRSNDILAVGYLANLVREREKALLLVTHNRFIADACDWVHEMKDGRIIATHPHGQRISVS